MTVQVLWHVTMSLDGFIAGPDDATRRHRAGSDLRFRVSEGVR